MFSAILIIIVALFTASFVFAVVVTVFVDEDYCSLPNDTPKVRLYTLKKIYPINPDKWSLHKGWVQYRDEKYNLTNIEIHLLDIISYSIWKNHIEKNKDIIKQSSKIQPVLDDVKKDIAKFEEENKKRTEEELKKLWAHKNN